MRIPLLRHAVEPSAVERDTVVMSPLASDRERMAE